MIRYLLRRLVFALATLLLLSMVTFGLVKYAPTDAQLINLHSENGDENYSYHEQIIQATRKAESMGLQFPVFYFSLSTADRPDTLDRIFPFIRRERLVDLLNQSGNWPAVQQFETALMAADDAARLDSSALAKPLRTALVDLHQAKNPAAIVALTDVARQLGAATAEQPLLDTLARAAQVLRSELRPENHWRPSFHWYGLHNQYHRWLTGFLCGEMGWSIAFGHPVWETLQFSLLSTLLINGLAFFLAFQLAIPLGIAMARRPGRFDRFSRWMLLLLHAMPGFWLGGVLLLLFATPHTGLYWIDGINLGAYDPDDGPFLLWAGQNADKFILPVATLTLHALALISLQLRGGLRAVMLQDFIRTARAKGVPEKGVYRRHAFRNSLIPLIAIFSSVFPALFAGSIVVEYLFNFPGMGMKTYSAYDHEDYPLLFAILMLGAVVTVLGNFLGDILYAWADPRVRFDKQ